MATGQPGPQQGAASMPTSARGLSFRDPLSSHVFQLEDRRLRSRPRPPQTDCCLPARGSGCPGNRRPARRRGAEQDSLPAVPGGGPHAGGRGK